MGFNASSSHRSFKIAWRTIPRSRQYSTSHDKPWWLAISQVASLFSAFVNRSHSIGGNMILCVRDCPLLKIASSFVMNFPRSLNPSKSTNIDISMTLTNYWQTGRLTDRLTERWRLIRTSIRWHFIILRKEGRKDVIWDIKKHNKLSKLFCGQRLSADCTRRFCRDW